MVIFAFFFYNDNTSVVVSESLLDRDPIARLCRAELDSFFSFVFSLVFPYMAVAIQLDPFKY